MVGAGYYWAINRSYDATYLAQYFTQRGFTHHVDFRAKPAAGSDFNVVVFGVNDRGEQQSNGERIKKSGLILNLAGRTIWDGLHGPRWKVTTSAPCRSGRVDGVLQRGHRFRSPLHRLFERHWAGYGLSFVFARLENIQRRAITTTP